MTITTHLSAPSAKPASQLKVTLEHLRTMTAWLLEAGELARSLDWLGKAEQHPEGSAPRDAAGVRDEVDRALSRFLREAAATQRVRAETTHCLDLLLPAMLDLMGDGPDALHLMRRYHELFGDERDPDGSVLPETVPDVFAQDTYLRVSALAGLAEEFPDHLQHSAREMHGWPMIVSRDGDIRAEFERIAERLEVGTDCLPDENDR